MHKLSALAAAVAFAALAAAPAAHAQGYVGFGVGNSKINIDCAGTTTCDDSDTGGKVFGGYRFGPNLAAEVNYFDFGRARATAPGAAAEIDSKGFGVGVAFMGEFAPNIVGVARIGVARIDADVSGSMGSLSAVGSDRSTQAYGGLSVGYRFTRNMSVDAFVDVSRAEYGGQKGNLRLIGIGLTAAF